MQSSTIWHQPEPNGAPSIVAWRSAKFCITFHRPWCEEGVRCRLKSGTGFSLQRGSRDKGFHLGYVLEQDGSCGNASGLYSGDFGSTLGLDADYLVGFLCRICGSHSRASHLPSRWFLVFLQLWKRRRHIPPKSWLIFNGLHGEVFVVFLSVPLRKCRNGTWN
jgi:hypothetical protein